MSPRSDGTAWHRAHRLADRLPFIFTQAAKRRAVSELLNTWRLELIAGRQLSRPASRNTADA